MPRVRVGVPLNTFTDKCDRYLVVARKVAFIEDHEIRKMMAELVMMRLFDDLQELVEGVAIRLACGATYMDGSTPVLLVPHFRDTGQALTAFDTLSRARPKHAKWSKAGFINDAVKYVLDPVEHFRITCSAVGSDLNEMRVVRNKIAHRRVPEYRNVVRRYYGAYRNNVSPGILLLSPRFDLLSSYIRKSVVIARSLCKA